MRDPSRTLVIAQLWTEDHLTFLALEREQIRGLGPRHAWQRQPSLPQSLPLSWRTAGIY
jgi:hypothetical protein